MDTHTVNSLSDQIIACFSDSCYVMDEGQWVHPVNTVENREGHSSMVISDGVMLLGGDGTYNTEVIPPAGEAQPGQFSIMHGRSHCTIALSTTLGIVTGGWDTSALVTSYLLPGGSPRPLPSLQEGRYSHACSSYQREQEQVGAILLLLPYLPPPHTPFFSFLFLLLTFFPSHVSFYFFQESSSSSFPSI